MVATNKSTHERWFLRRECYTKYKRGNDNKFREKFKPTEQSMLLSKWPKLFDLEMKGDQDKATALAQMAMMCPGKPATLVEIKEICQETTFYSPFCPGKTDATNMDAQPLDADEVHVINTKYIALKAAFDAERANQNINFLVMGAQDSLVAQGNANQTAIHKEGADTRAHITSALAPFKALLANPTEVEQAAVETNDVNENMGDESVAVETNDVNEKMDDEQNVTVAVETNDANEQAVLVETNGEWGRRKRSKSSMGEKQGSNLQMSLQRQRMNLGRQRQSSRRQCSIFGSSRRPRKRLLWRRTMSMLTLWRHFLTLCYNSWPEGGVVWQIISQTTSVVWRMKRQAIVHLRILHIRVLRRQVVMRTIARRSRKKALHLQVMMRTRPKRSTIFARLSNQTKDGIF